MRLMLLKSCRSRTNINSLFGNINNTQILQILGLIKTYAPQVGYFTAPQQVSILVQQN
jgi:iron complex outermembrane receptor protein